MTDVDLGQDILKPWIDGAVADLSVSSPGVVTDYSRLTLFADVEWKSVARVGPTKTKDEPPGVELPFVTPAGDGYGLFFDLAKGDRVVSLVGDRPQTPYWKTGEVAAPGQQQNHNPSNAVLFPGGRLSKQGPANAKGTMLVGALDGSATVVCTRARVVGDKPSPGAVEVTATGEASRIAVDAEQVALGAAAVSPGTKGAELLAALDAALTAASGAVAFGDGGEAAFAAFIATWNAQKNSALSAKVVVE